MSTPSGGSRVVAWIHDRPFDRDVAIVGLLLALALFPLRFVLTHLFAETLPLVLATACILYLIAWRSARSSRRRETGLGHSLPTLATPAARLAPAVTFVTIAVAIVAATLSGERTPLFHAVTAVGALSVFCQVFFAPDEDLVPGLVLLQIVALAATVRFTALHTSAGFVGIDIWTHITKLAVDVRETGGIAVMREHASRGAKYYASPLYHLLVVATAIMADATLEAALYLSLGAAMVLTLPLAYAAGRSFVPIRWALAGTALFAFSDHVIKWSIHLVPTSLGVLLFVAGFHYFVRVLNDRDPRDIALLVFFIVALTLSHQVSAFIMLVTIGTAAVVQYFVTTDVLYPDVSTRDLSGLLVFQTGLLTLVWSVTPYRGETFTEAMIAKLQETLVESAGLFNLQSTATSGGGAVAEQTPSIVDKVIPYLDVAGFMLLLGVTVLGCLYALKSDRTSLARLLLIFVVTVMILFALFLPIMGVGLFLPGRWFAFMYLPMAILGALGLGYVATNLNAKVATMVFLLLAVGYPGAMFVSTDATLDAPVFDQDQPRFGYNQAELTGMHTTGSMVADDQPVYTDSPYTEVYRRTETNPRATMLFVNPETGNTVNDVVVYRGYHSSGAPIFRVGDRSGIIPVERHEVCGPERSILYANGEVTMCVGEDQDAVPDDGNDGGGDDGSGGGEEMVRAVETAAGPTRR
ncbi:hypothetical protein [Haloarchaeobius amylolyticus]|uniref:hypothetical protein n=1 Tax=Haloarchaeobius amylolyticus TaxID=1198296 RepID=UPI002271BAC8|nr:hypothetical protein [Haloarchaeobius amylolyticus]